MASRDTRILCIIEVDILETRSVATTDIGKVGGQTATSDSRNSHSGELSISPTRSVVYLVNLHRSKLDSPLDYRMRPHLGLGGDESTLRKIMYH